MKHILLLLFFIPSYSIAFAQRDYGICDSTTYMLNNDTTVVAGKTKLYLFTSNTLLPLFDFTTSDTNEYIRDFDIVKPDLWYTVVGGKYIGFPSQLFKSTNRGQTWQLDTSYYALANSTILPTNFLQCINNFQHLQGDTLILFMSYYESGIIYSTNGGLTWTKWFDNQIAHYQGMFACNNKYYIFGYQGDGFRAWMFGFDRPLLFSPDSTGLWQSYTPGGYHPPCSTVYDTANCIYPTPNISRCATYNFFKQRIDSLCAPLQLHDINKLDISIFPNPTKGYLQVDLKPNPETKFVLYNSMGQQINTFDLLFSKNKLDVVNFPTGIYFYHIIAQGNIISKGKLRID